MTDPPRVLDEAHYSGPGWMEANARISRHPEAAHWIASQYGSRQWRDGRRTAVCAAGCNTPLWQEAVMRFYGLVSA